MQFDAIELPADDAITLQFDAIELPADDAITLQFDAIELPERTDAIGRTPSPVLA